MQYTGFFWTHLFNTRPFTSDTERRQKHEEWKTYANFRSCDLP